MEVNMPIVKILNFLKEVNGYLGAGVFTPQGEMLEGVTEISGIKFEEAGSVIHDSLKDAKEVVKQIGFGNLDMIQLYTEMGIIFAVCYADKKLHYHTILIIKNDGNVAMAKIKLKKAVEALKEVL
jgi:predicted regulator of Ras-like GTPase activity (Roadblock/LC7/MglB family)